MRKILFYITGHGFGHATRTIEVVNQLVKRDPQVRPIINTTVPEWLFKQEVAADFEYILCENDIGAVQRDWRRVDKFETLRRYADFIKKEPDILRAQINFVTRNDIGAVVSDIPAMAFVVAKRAGVPGLGITNFSWDWIYTPYLDEYPEYRSVVEHIRECYSMADRLLRLPFYGDLSAFPVIEDIPLIARRAKLNRNEVIKRLNLDGGKKIILLYLGQSSRHSHYSAAAAPLCGAEEAGGVGFDHGKLLSDETRRREDYLFVSYGDFKAPGVSFQDLVMAADAVVTKPGYGIVSDCIANRTPILYTSREDFIEYHALVDGIKRYAQGQFVPREDLLGGHWITHLDKLLSTARQWPQADINGAEVAAQKILEAV